MLPSTLALVGSTIDRLTQLSAHAAVQGVAVTPFENASELIAHPKAFEFGFYVLGYSSASLSTEMVITLLRRRTEAGILVVSTVDESDVHGQVITAGADVYLVNPLRPEDVLLAVRGIERRLHRQREIPRHWHLDRNKRTLTTPDGTMMSLGAKETKVLASFAIASTTLVTREQVLSCLGRSSDDKGASLCLNSLICRLRRRIEEVWAHAQPLQSRWGIGYIFRDPLTLE